MRWVYLTVVIVFALGIVIFSLQNLDIVTMSFLGFNARVPLALLAMAIYVAGALTGSGLYALLRQSLERSRMGAVR